MTETTPKSFIEQFATDLYHEAYKRNAYNFPQSHHLSQYANEYPELNAAIANLEAGVKNMQKAHEIILNLQRAKGW